MAILIVALVTALIRSAPFVIFGGKKELPNNVIYLGKVLPPAIMIILVFYCIRNIELTAFPYGFAEMISIGLVIFIQYYSKNSFLSILLGTSLYMVLIRTIFSV